jgi:ankyrin repeat protein
MIDPRLRFDGTTRELAAALDASPEVRQRRDERGRGWLHVISFNTQFTEDQVDLLVMGGFSVNEPDTDGNTPLHHSRLRACTRALLRHGADPNARNRDRCTPIHSAASRGYTDLLSMRVAAGGDLHALGAKAANGETRATRRVRPRWTWFWG